MIQSGGQMSVRNLLHAEVVQTFQVHLCFGALEVGDSILSVIDRKERQKLLEVSNLLIGDLETSLEGKDIAFLLTL
jgi:hypothetical protein